LSKTLTSDGAGFAYAHSSWLVSLKLHGHSGNTNEGKKEIPIVRDKMPVQGRNPAPAQLLNAQASC
jgi:hypothetical protein